MNLNLNLNLVTAFDIDGWWLIEVDDTASTGPWPGFASVVVSPAGDIVVLGDGNPKVRPDVDEREAADDVAWARRELARQRRVAALDVGVPVTVALHNGYTGKPSGRIDHGVIEAGTNPAVGDRSFWVHWSDDSYCWVAASKLVAA